jgi:hypothetical protein
MTAITKRQAQYLLKGPFREALWLNQDLLHAIASVSGVCCDDLSPEELRWQIEGALGLTPSEAKRARSLATRWLCQVVKAAQLTSEIQRLEDGVEMRRRKIRRMQEQNRTER